MFLKFYYSTKTGGINRVSTIQPMAWGSGGHLVLNTEQVNVFN